MSNAAGAPASREEEIAFLAMEQVLEVEIKLADAGAGNQMPDGSWTYPDGRRGIVEVTSPPAKALMAKWAAAKRAGRPQSESGSIDARIGELAAVCTEMLETDWARENVNKLLSQPAHERHLFLFGRGHDVNHYFYRLSDSYDDGTSEPVKNLGLPGRISDVWFRGRSRREEKLGTRQTWLARFQAGTGWHRYIVDIREQHLPAPNKGLADDSVPEGWRQAKDRSSTPDE